MRLSKEFVQPISCNQELLHAEDFFSNVSTVGQYSTPPHCQVNLINGEAMGVQSGEENIKCIYKPSLLIALHLIHCQSVSLVQFLKYFKEMGHRSFDSAREACSQL